MHAFSSACLSTFSLQYWLCWYTNGHINTSSLLIPCGSAPTTERGCAESSILVSSRYPQSILLFGYHSLCYLDPFALFFGPFACFFGVST
ncbi:hypothetical protein BGW80DRAFT_1315080 [Lactifluus volemus]|nr:hypothetical protein BGW80DRAFT_1315080 [Lactifluus volemus]